MTATAIPFYYSLEEKPGDADRSNFKLHWTVDFWTNYEADVPGARSNGAFNMCVKALRCTSHIMLHTDTTKLGIQLLILSTCIARMFAYVRIYVQLHYCNIACMHTYDCCCLCYTPVNASAAYHFADMLHSTRVSSVKRAHMMPTHHCIHCSILTRHCGFAELQGRLRPEEHPDQVP